MNAALHRHRKTQSYSSARGTVRGWILVSTGIGRVHHFLVQVFKIDPETYHRKPETSPNVRGTSPKSAGISPKGAGTSPRAMGTSPMSTGISPISAGISPISAGISPMGAGISPMSAGISPRDQVNFKERIKNLFKNLLIKVLNNGASYFSYEYQSGVPP